MASKLYSLYSKSGNISPTDYTTCAEVAVLLERIVNCFERILTVKIFSVEYYPNKDAVMSSWVYKKLAQLAKEKNPAITREVGKKLFEFGLGIDG